MMNMEGKSVEYWHQFSGYWLSITYCHVTLNLVLYCNFCSVIQLRIQEISKDQEIKIGRAGHFVKVSVSNWKQTRSEDTVLQV